MKSPVLRIYDCQLAEGQTEGEMIVRVEEPTGCGFLMRMFYSGVGGYMSSGHHPFFLHRDVEEIRLPFKLNRPLKAGDTTYMALAFYSFWGGWKPTFGGHGDNRANDRALISLKDEGRKAPPLKGWGRSEVPGRRYALADRIAELAKSRGLRETFHSNLIDGFKATDSGFDEAGKPCWKTQMGHGRAQINNGEEGLYTDPVLHRTEPFRIEDGVRVLATEPLDQPVSYKGKTWRISAPMLTTETLFRGGHGLWEARFRSNAERGSWPAFWRKPSPHPVWPPEYDTVEINNGDGLPFFTQWDGRGGSANKYGFKPDAAALRWLTGKVYSQQDMHTYSDLWLEDITEWYLDGFMVMSQPTMNRIGEIPGADHDGRMYAKLNIAMGGQGGEPDSTPDARMWVEEVRVLEVNPATQPKPEEPKPDPKPEPEDPPVPDPKPIPPAGPWTFSGTIAPVPDGYDVAFRLRKPDPG